MLYIPDTEEVKSRSLVTVKDSDSDKVVLAADWYSFWKLLNESGVMPQTVVGLFKHENTLLITPVDSVELQCLAMLKNPHFFVRDTLGDGGANHYKSYGLYNFTEHTDRYSAPEHAFSVAKLLLEHGGETTDNKTQNYRIETTREYIAVCVHNTKFQSTYLRFDIDDYKTVNRLYTKYRVLKKGDFQTSMQMHVENLQS